ncbi:MAG: hypothetical protein IAE85_20685 [Anaerolinea sp.]|nr:hypothetical protein [Anaerolinea sp.]
MKWRIGTGLILIYLLLIAATAGVLAAPVQQDANVEERLLDIRAQEPTFRDDFSTLPGDWSEDADAMGNFIGVVEDVYSLRIETPLDVPLLAGVADVTAQNFLMEVDAAPVELYGYSELGLVFRSDADESHLFLVTTEGEYALIKVDRGAFDFVVEPTFSPAIDLDEAGVIRLGVLAEGDRISLLANGELLATVSDPNPVAGEVGVLITGSDAGPLEVAFDNFTFWDLEALEEVEEVQPTATPDPPVTVMPAEELAALEERLDAIRNGDPFFSDDFATWEGSWLMGGDAFVALHRSGVEDYSVQVLEEGAGGAVLNSQLAGMTFTDYLFEADIALAEDATDAEASYGLLFRVDWDAADFYMFMITEDQYLLAKRIDGEIETLIEETGTDAIDSGEGAVNRLGVLVEGDQITLLINDKVVGAAEDASLETGSIGLSVVGAVELIVDDVTLWLLDTPEAPEAAAMEEPALGDLNLIRNQEAVYFDEFRRASGDWFLPERESHEFAYRNRTLQIEALEPELVSYALSEALIDQMPANFLLEVDAAPADPEAGIYGLVFGYRNDDNFLSFWLTGDEYTLQRQVDDEWETLVDWTASDAIAAVPGAVNRLGVLVQDDQIKLFVNDQQIDRVGGIETPPGTIGLTAVGRSADGSFVVAYDDLELWAVEAVAAGAEDEENDSAPPTTVAERLAELRANDPLYAESFRRTSDAWADEGDEDASFFVEEGAYHAQIEADGIAFWYVSPDVIDLNLTDYLVEVDVWAEQQVSEAEYGLLFRYQDDDNFYWFTISDGWYTVYKQVEDEWTLLLDWTESGAIAPEENDRNRLGALVNDNSAILLINDQMVAQVGDSSLSTGAAGVAAGAFGEGGLQVAFDDFIIWRIDTPQPDVDTPQPDVDTPQPGEARQEVPGEGASREE